MPDASMAKSLIVTGGSSGIGAVLCRLAARQGWHVWIGYGEGSDRAARLADELNFEDRAARAVALPLREPDRLREAVARIAEKDSSVSALALCGAPAPDVASLLKLTPEHFRNQHEAAVVGNYVLLTEVWRRCFRPRGGGQVVAVLSAAQGPPTTPHMASYVAAKCGLEGLLNAAAAELGRAGLRIAITRPGYVETPMLNAFERLLLERARASAAGQAFLKPEAVAAALLHGLNNPSATQEIVELSLDDGATLERAS